MAVMLKGGMWLSEYKELSNCQCKMGCMVQCKMGYIAVSVKWAVWLDVKWAV